METNTSNTDDSLFRVCLPLSPRIEQVNNETPASSTIGNGTVQFHRWQIFERLNNSVSGLFLGSGASLAGAGPGGAVLAYVLMGTVMGAVISCLIEMTALMPVNAPVMEFPRRFLDRGVGFSVGWMYWYAIPAIRRISI